MMMMMMMMMNKVTYYYKKLTWATQNSSTGHMQPVGRELRTCYIMSDDRVILKVVGESICVLLLQTVLEFFKATEKKH
jgi:hypothetical protein